MFRENTLLRKNRADQHWDVLGKQFDPKTIREREAKVKIVGFLSTSRKFQIWKFNSKTKQLIEYKNLRSSKLTFRISVTRSADGLYGDFASQKAGRANS